MQWSVKDTGFSQVYVIPDRILCSPGVNQQSSCLFILFTVQATFPWDHQTRCCQVSGLTKIIAYTVTVQ